MKFSIDSSVIEKEGLSMQEFSVILYYLSGGTGILNEEMCDSLWNMNILQKVIDGYQLNPHVTPTIKAWIAFSDSSVPGVRELSGLADSLRMLYPEGKKAGTSYYWRDSTKVIVQRLAVFFKKYSHKFTNEQIVEATRAYVSSFNGNYQYMQLLKYFIYKDDTSQLLSYLENAGQDNFQRDWADKLI